MTIEEAKNNIKEYLNDINKCISDDEDYLRGRESALNDCLRILEEVKD